MLAINKALPQDTLRDESGKEGPQDEGGIGNVQRELRKLSKGGLTGCGNGVGVYVAVGEQGREKVHAELSHEPWG